MRTFSIELVGPDDYLTEFRMVMRSSSATVALVRAMHRYYELIEKKSGIEDTDEDAFKLMLKLDIKEI